MGPWGSLCGSQTPVFDLTSDLLAWERFRERFPRLAWSLRDDRLPRAVEDRYPEDLLEPLHLHAERRLRDVAGAGGVAEAPEPVYGDEVAELLHGESR
jgi:hypothetical protein